LTPGYTDITFKVKVDDVEIAKDGYFINRAYLYGPKPADDKERDLIDYDQVEVPIDRTIPAEEDENIIEKEIIKVKPPDEKGKVEKAGRYSPKTGDDTRILGSMMLFFGSIILISGLIYFVKRKKPSEKDER
jgi:LPXTG-motif cell wall-anchored protein